MLGTKVKLPVLIAPCGAHKRAHPEGELATYRAATACGTILAVSANSNTSFEDLAKAANGHLWVQMYPFRDKEMTKDWLKRAKESGYEAVVVTLDSQWPPNASATPQQFADRGLIHGASVRPLGRRQGREGSDTRRPWQDLEGLKSGGSCSRQGVCRRGFELAPRSRPTAYRFHHGGENPTIHYDGRSCVRSVGRGGRQNGNISRRRCPARRRVARRRLGAKAVFIGRPLFWGLAVDGEQGVVRVLNILREEMEITMAKCGRPTIASIDATTIVKVPPLG